MRLRVPSGAIQMWTPFSRLFFAIARLSTARCRSLRSMAMKPDSRIAGPQIGTRNSSAFVIIRRFGPIT